MTTKFVTVPVVGEEPTRLNIAAISYYRPSFGAKTMEVYTFSGVIVRVAMTVEDFDALLTESYWQVEGIVS